MSDSETIRARMVCYVATNGSYYCCGWKDVTHGGETPEGGDDWALDSLDSSVKEGYFHKVVIEADVPLPVPVMPVVEGEVSDV